MGPAMVLPGGVDNLAFLTYLDRVLGPILRPGQVVLVDNLSAYTSPRVWAIVASYSCSFAYLPPSSPDSSPTELAFA